MVRLGHTYLVTGKSEAAVETMKKILDLHPRNMDALTVCATTLDQTGRAEEARTYYERGLAVEPESRYLRTNYAGNLASSGQFREAIKIYETLIADFPERAGVLSIRRHCLFLSREYDRAVFYLKQAVAIGPTPTGFFNLAVAYEKSGNPAEAAKCLRHYLKNPEGESEVNIQKARAELERLEKLPVSR